ncbi:MAG: hypothetical protein FWD45_02835 [Coriobacteriia bacterium]|nr:hypothetical protein [Coriobacteriia bacterium]
MKRAQSRFLSTLVVLVLAFGSIGVMAFADDIGETAGGIEVLAVPDYVLLTAYDIESFSALADVEFSYPDGDLRETMIYFLVWDKSSTETMPTSIAEVIAPPADGTVYHAAMGPFTPDASPYIATFTAIDMLPGNDYRFLAAVIDVATDDARMDWTDVTTSTDPLFSLVSVAGQAITPTAGIGFLSDPFIASITVPNSKSTLTLTDIVLNGADLWAIADEDGFVLICDGSLGNAIPLQVGANEFLIIIENSFFESGLDYFYIVTINREAPVETPRTGDSTGLLISWVALLAYAGGMTSLLYRSVKRRKSLA